MYVRVVVAVMAHELANVVEDQEVKDDDDAGLVVLKTQALNFGRRFLLELLNAAVKTVSIECSD